MNILIVGGTFDNEGGKPSGLINKLFTNENNVNIEVHNGGYFSEIKVLLNKANNFDTIVWMPNIPNEGYTKLRNVKEVAPHKLLITSKRNDSGKYSFQELINHSLGLKANLTIEFRKNADGKFDMTLFDPLGVCWYKGTNTAECRHALYNRLNFLHSITRQGTVKFDAKVPDINIEISKCDEICGIINEFIEIVKDYADIFTKFVAPAKNVTRFLGNASMRNFRCIKGFPSFVYNNVIFVSQRNVDKKNITAENFVSVYMDKETNKIYYAGDNKPSVDTPIQVRLYNKLSQIRYMIHSHCYLADGIWTETPIPCGGIEEVEEVLTAIINAGKTLDEKSYRINLKGHGSILMGHSLDDMKNAEYVKRELPETLS